MTPIKDEFTKLLGKVSRQRIWQLRRKRDGLCETCGNPRADHSARCLRCMEGERERQRKRTGAKVRYHSKSYRLREEGV